MTNTTTQHPAQRLRELRASGILPVAYRTTCGLDRRCVEKSAETTVSVDALRMELRNFMQHGCAKHAGDWYHEWSRTTRGTLSWDC